MQYPQQQHSHKELGSTVLPLEDKMKNPIYFGFIHQSVEEIQAEYQVVGFFFRIGADIVPINLISKYKTQCALVSYIIRDLVLTFYCF